CSASASKSRARRRPNIACRGALSAASDALTPEERPGRAHADGRCTAVRERLPRLRARSCPGRRPWRKSNERCRPILQSVVSLLRKLFYKPLFIIDLAIEARALLALWRRARKGSSRFP